MPKTIEDTQEELIDISMFSEKQRIASFKAWRVKNTKYTKEDLAKAGLYYHKSGTRKYFFRCAFCWEKVDLTKNDNPHEKHLNQNPSCPFFKLEKSMDSLTIEDLCLSIINENDKNHINLRKQRINENISKELSEIEKMLESL